MKAIINGQIVLEDKVIKDHVLIFDEKIERIIEKKNFRESSVDEIVDAKGDFVCPGLIDIHIHGSGGADAMDATPEALKIINDAIIKNGVTAYLPTTMTQSEENVHKALINIKSFKEKNSGGVRVLGAHLEGPFISKKYKGAQNEYYIQPPNLEFIKDYLDIIKIITLAPEEDNDFEFIKAIKEGYQDIVLSIGHTDADFEIAKAAFKEGVRSATHTFNAMTPLHHRNPGVVGAIFSTDMHCEIIADTIHVNPGFFEAFVNINGKEKVILITDSMCASSMPDGEYELGGQKVIVKDNAARLEDGTLAGSTLTLNTAVKNIIKYTDFKLYEVIRLASLNPAELLGVDKELGSIKEGKEADIFIMDQDYKVKETYIRGVKRY